MKTDGDAYYEYCRRLLLFTRDYGPKDARSVNRVFDSATALHHYIVIDNLQSDVYCAVKASIWFQKRGSTTWVVLERTV